MPKDYAALDYNTVRRSDRAVTDDEWIRDLLRRAPVGTLATVYDGQPFINTNLFVYEAAAHAIYMHTARLGRTRANVDAGGRVCFSVTEMGRLLPAAAAVDFSVEYKGVIIFGSATIISGDQARAALQLLADKYFTQFEVDVDYRGVSDEDLARTAVYKIAIETWSGKMKQVDDDFPGAFFYRMPS